MIHGKTCVPHLIQQPGSHNGKKEETSSKRKKGWLSRKRRRFVMGIKKGLL